MVMSCLQILDQLTKNQSKNHTVRSCSGLILGIFLTEPVGLAPHNLTEPERKTLSPVKILYQI